MSLSVFPLHATVLIPMSTEDLAHEADVVVVGRVGTISATMKGQDDPAFSYVILDVLETLKGKAQGSVTLKVLGGQTGDDPKTSRIAGVPRFYPMQKAVFYLRARPEEDGRFYGVAGWSQGKRDLVDDSTLKDGRKLGVLREEVRRSLESPRPRKFKSLGKGTPAPPGTGKATPSIRPLKPLKNSSDRKREAVGTGTQPGKAPPPLTEPERRKLREMREEAGR